MTREQIEALTGRELDKAISEQVMWWPNCRVAHGWHPSKSISDAWEVVTAMRAKGWFFALNCVIETDESMIVFVKPSVEELRVYVPYADEPAGICRAALLALAKEREAKEATSTPASGEVQP